MSEQWAIIELLGHNACAGRISATKELGGPTLTVEIPCDPATNERGASFRKVHFGPGAIYALHYCDETRARLHCNAQPYTSEPDDDIADFLKRTTARLTGERNLGPAVEWSADIGTWGVADIPNNRTVVDVKLGPIAGVTEALLERANQAAEKVLNDGLALSAVGAGG